MKRLVSGVLALSHAFVTWGPAVADQSDNENLTWSLQALPVEGRSDEVDLVFKAGIVPGWILYSSDFQPVDFGPRPAKLTLSTQAQASADAVGELKAIGSASKTDKNFTGPYTYTYFSGTAELRQRVRISKGARTVSGQLTGQTCFEKSGLCALFKEEFSVAVP